jgi:hypothetical protein
MSAFKMNNIQRADVTLIWPVDDEITFRQAQAEVRAKGTLGTIRRITPILNPRFEGLRFVETIG